MFAIVPTKFDNNYYAAGLALQKHMGLLEKTKRISNMGQQGQEPGLAPTTPAEYAPNK